MLNIIQSFKISNNYVQQAAFWVSVPMQFQNKTAKHPLKQYWGLCKNLPLLLCLIRRIL